MLVRIKLGPQRGVKLNPVYIPNFVDPKYFSSLLADIPWEDRTETRRECFMSEGGGLSYTYGSGRGIRTYTSIDYTDVVRVILEKINSSIPIVGKTPMNGCFLNGYFDEHQHLGWHADNFDKMDHTCPVVVVSFGEEREIWWRRFGETGVTPQEQKRLLQNGSMFIMPPGMQHTHEHRIPKGGRQMSPRISLTFRRFLTD